MAAVDYCRPPTSALRSLNWKVSFLAVRSLTLLSLVDPLLTSAALNSSPQSGQYGRHRPALGIP
jgi:hypothetical protein